MKKRIIAFSALLFCTAVYAQGDKHKVAVYMSGKNQTGSTSQIVGFALTDALSSHKNFTATERTADFLNTIQQENLHQFSGAVDNSQIAEIGKKSGVRYVCVAEVIAFSEAIRDARESLIIARFIDVETALVVGSDYKIAVLYQDDITLATAQMLGKDLIDNFQRRDADKDAKKEKTAIYLAGGGESGIGRIMQQLLVDAVAKSRRYAVTERTNSFMETLNKELGHQYSGEVDDAQLAKLGVQFGVRYVIALKVAGQIVNIRVIDVVSGDIMKSKTGTAYAADIRSVEKSVVDLTAEIIGSSGAPPRRKLESDRLRAYKGFSVGYSGSGGAHIGTAGLAYIQPVTRFVSIVPEANFLYGQDGTFYYKFLQGGDALAFYGASVPLLLQLSTNSTKESIAFAEVGGHADILFATVSDKAMSVFNTGVAVGGGVALRGDGNRMELNARFYYGSAYSSYSIGARFLF
jgi:curli biogenesis system outer membrane secretion channel CsgG